MKVLVAYFSTKEMVKFLATIYSLMEASVAFAVHDDRGGSGAYTVTIADDDESKTYLKKGDFPEGVEFVEEKSAGVFYV